MPSYGFAFPKVAHLAISPHTWSVNDYRQIDLAILGLYPTWGGTSWSGSIAAKQTELALLRADNPGIKLVPYVNLIEAGDEAVNDDHTHNIKVAAQDWWLRNAANARIQFYPGANMINLTTNLPADSLGRWYPEWYGDYISFDRWGNGEIAMDGFFADNFHTNAQTPGNSSDPNNDSVDETDASWAATYRTRQVAFVNRVLNNCVPAFAKCIANCARTDLQEAQYFGLGPHIAFCELINVYRIAESAGGGTTYPQTWDGFRQFLQAQENGSRDGEVIVHTGFFQANKSNGSNVLSSVTPMSWPFEVGQSICGPGIPANTKVQSVNGGAATVTLDKNCTATLSNSFFYTGTTPIYSQMRYWLATTLICTNGYLAINSPAENYGSAPMFFDELDNVGVSKGYLGFALEAKKTASYSGTEWRRTFQNGIAILNTSPGTSITVDVGVGLYRRINGTQDPTQNSGAVVNAPFSLGPMDGIVLLNEQPAPTRRGGLGGLG